MVVFSFLVEDTTKNYIVPRYPSSHSWYTILSAGLQRLGTGFIGKGFYVGYRSDGRVLYALQTQNELYEGIHNVGVNFNKHVTISWNKTEETLHLYIDHVWAASTGKVLRKMQKTPGETYANYLSVGSRFDHTFTYIYYSISELTVWKFPQEEEYLTKLKTNGSYH